MRTAMLSLGLMIAGLGAAPIRAETTGLDAVAFGRCLVAEDRRAALTLFAMLPPSDAAADLSRHAACAGGAASAPAMTIRGGIAEALYKRDFREWGLPPRRVSSDLAQLAQLALPERADVGGGVFALGHCVARWAPNDLDQLFATPPGSAREGRVIDRLVQRFAPCQSAGTSVTINRAHVRALLAQTAYELSRRDAQGLLRETEAK